MKLITIDELLTHYPDPATREHLVLAWHRYPTAEALVLFENQMLDSSALGTCTTVVVGPENTFPSVEACEGKWLNDLPSQRQHAIAYCTPPRPWTLPDAAE